MKTFLIIGGSSGMGASTVERLIRNGDRVIATYHKNEITSQHPNLSTLSYDVMGYDPLNLEGIDKLDGMVYCPGSISLKPYNRFTEEELIQDIRLNVLGAHKIIKEVSSFLKKSPEASIVLFSSVAAGLGFPYHLQVGISKGAVEGMTKSLAAELSPGIRVNAIAPSLTNTPLAENLVNTDEKREANGKRHPMGRIGESQDISSMVSFLLSDQSSWITGQIFNVDGGISSLKK